MIIMSTEHSESTESSCNSSSSSSPSSPSSVLLQPLPQINSKNRLKRCRAEEVEEEKMVVNNPNPKKMNKNNNNGSTSGDVCYVGVRMRAWGKWVSEIREPKKKSRIWLGTFATPEMAARAHDVAAMSIKGTSAILNFPQFSHLLPRPVTCSPRDIQNAAVKAAHMDHLNPKFSILPETSAATTMTSSSSSLSLVSGVTSSSSSHDDEESRPSPPELVPEATGQLSEIVELPKLGSSYELVESTQSLFESDEWWDNNYGNCEYFFGQDNYISSNMEFTGLENVVSTSFESFLWQH
ncbi:hypothetical protein EJD97_002198 [Solanum chilense]|uniref:AP2/ERF domain-containing protein n=1 Tax=Solanum chilense TaxID=4083 RepID=A0A6N2ANJ9_SOLCI|nr:hypothetical protein EJD97_002198 [Solanum chilense]